MKSVKNIEMCDPYIVTFATSCMRRAASRERSNKESKRLHIMKNYKRVHDSHGHSVSWENSYVENPQ